MSTVYGPYETREQAARDAAETLGYTVGEPRAKAVAREIEHHGVTLGAADRLAVLGLAGTVEPWQLQVVLGMVARAYDAGRRAPITSRGRP
jgi:hypothetical protein